MFKLGSEVCKEKSNTNTGLSVNNCLSVHIYNVCMYILHADGNGTHTLQSAIYLYHRSHFLANTDVIIMCVLYVCVHAVLHLRVCRYRCMLVCMCLEA